MFRHLIHTQRFGLTRSSTGISNYKNASRKLYATITIHGENELSLR